MRQDLLPKLPSENILVMDNASFHKSKSLKEKIKVAGHTLEYLPPYTNLKKASMWYRRTFQGVLFITKL